MIHEKTEFIGTDADNCIITAGKLKADTDLSGVCADGDGTFAQIRRYNGYFNGEGHTISGLNITDGSSAGLFGTVTESGSIAARCFGTIQDSEGPDSVENVGKGNDCGITGIGKIIEYCTNYANATGGNTGGITGDAATDTPARRSVLRNKSD